MILIAVYARDWGCYCEQIDANHEFTLIYGWVIGKLIREDDEKIIIAHHWFPNEDQLRHTTTVQKSCIIKRHEYAVEL